MKTNVKRKPAAKLAEELLTAAGGATMSELIRATGGPQYNVLARLEGRGYTIRKLKEDRVTRYFAIPPRGRTFEATVTSQGQITIPKDVREQLHLQSGSKVQFSVEAGDRAVIRPISARLKDLVGILPRPKTAVSLDEMDEAIGQAAVSRYRRSGGRKSR